MNIRNQKGFSISLAMAVYVVVKAVLNMIIGSFSLSSLMLALAMACLLFVWIKNVNYITAGIFVLVVLMHLPANLGNISSNWIYLLEGGIDILCAVLLTTNRDVRENYSWTKWE